MIGLLLKGVKDASIELPAFAEFFPYSDPYTNRLKGAAASASANAAGNCPLASPYTSILYG